MGLCIEKMAMKPSQTKWTENCLQQGVCCYAGRRSNNQLHIPIIYYLA